MTPGEIYDQYNLVDVGEIWRHLPRLWIVMVDIGTAWWFQTCFLFSIMYGMSSFPLTNSYFSRWLSHHQPYVYNYIYIYIYSMDCFKWHFTGKPHMNNGKIDGFRWRCSLKPIHWYPGRQDIPIRDLNRGWALNISMK